MMFSFGLFATHTPYLVLAALYICYLGSWLISSLFPQLPADIDSFSCQTIVVEQSTTVHVGDNKISSKENYHFFVKDFGEINESIYIGLSERGIPFIIQAIVPGPVIVYVWQLFNRPPPFLF
jgi:hypothetical protein